MTKFRQQLNLFKRLDALIRRKATGSPKQLASRLEVSQAQLFRYLEELRLFGAPIAYCKTRKCYFYEEPFTLVF